MHTIALNSAAEQVMTLGQTVLVTEASCERRHRLSLDLIANNG